MLRDVLFHPSPFENLFISTVHEDVHIDATLAALDDALPALQRRLSGSEPGSEGSMIELFRGERFLEDGDEVVLRGRAANGVELGEVRGRVLPSHPG